jgi:hypothetical protein
MDADSAESVHRGNCTHVQGIAAQWINIREQSGCLEHLEWCLTYNVLRR